MNLERETRLELATPTLARLMTRPAPRKATEILAGGVPWRKVGARCCQGRLGDESLAGAPTPAS